jgi:hypothetical protein
MKKTAFARLCSLAVLVFSAFLLVSCASDTVVKQSYIAPGVTSIKFSKVLVVALVPNDIDRRLAENTIKANIRKASPQASHELIPGVLGKGDKDRLIKAMNDGQFDGLIVLRIKGTETIVSQGGTTALPMEYLAFSGYYGQVYDVGAFYSSDTRQTYADRVFYLEAAIFDVKTQKLLWTCLTESTKGNIAGQNIGALCAEVAKTLKTKLEAQDLVP